MNIERRNNEYVTGPQLGNVAYFSAAFNRHHLSYNVFMLLLYYLLFRQSG